MYKFINIGLHLYDRLAELLTKRGVKNVEVNQVKTRAMLILWTCTTFVMWCYVLYCILAFPLSSPVPWAGLAFTIIHSAVPLVFKFTQSYTAAGLTLSLTGLGFQTFFCVFTGGAYSPAAIWLTFHPVIIGFFASTSWIIFSVSLNTLIIVTLYLLGLGGHTPVDQLPTAFRDAMLISSYVGLDVLVAIFTVLAIKINIKKNLELKKSRDFSDSLVRILCHDINNPLLVLKLSLRKPNSPIFMESVTTATADIERITTTVAAWTSHRDGKVAMRFEAIPVPEVLAHLETTFRERLKEKELSLVLNNHCGEESFWADRSAMFYQVLNNLVSNAIKFSHPGSSIEVDFSFKGPWFQATVRDHGIGMPEELISKVFSPFAATTSEGTNHEKGIGFGLPIVATVLEKMNGKIEILSYRNSPDQKGTKFTIFLPRQAPS